VESGRKNDRPVLAQALAHAKRVGGVLLIAKLDRLARNVAFIANLMESGVEFRACDMPEADRLMIHVYAAFAEDEARRISQRTKDALAAAKARGVRLGAANPASRNLTAVARTSGSRRQRDDARAYEAQLIPTVLSMKSDGKSLRSIAEALNSAGHVTRAGQRWSAVQILRMLQRAAE